MSSILTETRRPADAAGFLAAAARRFAINAAGGSQAVAATRKLPAVSAALASLAEQLGAGDSVTPAVGGLSEAERYQVSLLIEHAVSRAQAEQVPVPVKTALHGALKAWDSAAGVDQQNPALKQFIAAGRPSGVQPRDLGA